MAHQLRRLALATLLLAAAVPAGAQSDLSGRVDRIEKELHAVQRKVFPGGNPDYFEPQITAPPAAPAVTGTPATSALGDLTARVNALEGQVRDLTNTTEVNNHRLSELEQQLAHLQANTDTRLGKLESAAPGGGAATGQPPAFGPSGRAPLPAGTQPAPPPGDTMGDEAAASGPAPAAVPAPARTGDPAEDAYMAAYQLWTQKRYGDAEAALKDVVAKYPSSKRASYAQNLLGRAYMDDGQLSAAAEAFLANYKRFPHGERAPDSLFYLGQTLTRLKKQSQACQVYDEFNDVYGATANATLKARVTQGRADAKCGG